ncbi:helix-turn-helix domain-containing protein [Nocardia sp. NBC_01499]|uniref:helix-turn-helix transcriptional regulator n=1 Tax=Nocardia sp. NBC_01499 TaxID=2903597 RepID=UPI003869EAEE
MSNSVGSVNAAGELSGLCWLTRAEVAARTRFSVKTLANWAVEVPPKGPRFVKVGGKCRYRETDVIAWQDAQYQAAA